MFSIRLRDGLGEKKKTACTNFSIYRCRKSVDLTGKIYYKQVNTTCLFKNAVQQELLQVRKNVYVSAGRTNLQKREKREMVKEVQMVYSIYVVYIPIWVNPS